MVTKESVLAALEDVHDPCSLIYGSDVSFLELGMVEEVSINDEGVVSIGLFLDDPNCFYLPKISSDIITSVKKIDGVTDVVLSNRGDAVWTPDRMTVGGRVKLEEFRERRAARLREIASRGAAAQQGRRTAVQAG